MYTGATHLVLERYSEQIDYSAQAKWQRDSLETETYFADHSGDAFAYRKSVGRYLW
jgi:hypothetical protein